MSETDHFKLQQALRHITGKLLKFPVELLLSITFFVLILIGIENMRNNSEELFISVIPAAPYLATIRHSKHYLAK